jgi:aconitate hydratase
MAGDPFKAKSVLTVGGVRYTYFRVRSVQEAGLGTIDHMPYSVRVLLESQLRNLDGFIVTNDDVAALASYNARAVDAVEMPFMPGRVVLQDFTGVPCVVDLAAMRDAMRTLGGDPDLINPDVPCDLVIDHSVQVDDFATRVSLTINAQKEFERNNERYRFLKWGQESLSNFRVVPPATGIVHQVNLEYLARGVLTKTIDGRETVYPDSLVGTDSHTTMINALGVLGWGVGGIEAEAVMLGQPVYMLTPEVVGFKLSGRLREGATATDLVLTVTEMLRKHGVVEKFVEFFGPGVAELSLPDRATIANMAPEYGATCGFFPIDRVTIDYLRQTARDEHDIELTEAYAKANDLWWQPGKPDPVFTSVLELDLASVVPSLAGPKRPQDRVELTAMQNTFKKALTAPIGPKGLGIDPSKTAATGTVRHTTERPGEKPGTTSAIGHGAVVIAAITSCTNTSNPDVMLAAGLVARKARALGLARKPWVKTSLAPGSKVVTEYLDKARLSDDLDAVGFANVGYGCTTCIGNSGPLPPEVEAAIKEGGLVAASVLSGNRNFEGRVHPKVKANFLASPPQVVAYAIAGTVDIDLASGVIATTPAGQPVYLKDIWPTHAEVQALKASSLSPDQYRDKYGDVFTGNPTWNQVPVSKSDLYGWDNDSTYIQNPPFFEGMAPTPPGFGSIRAARVLCLLGDSVTTDHISPAGRIEPETPAGQYLQSLGVAPADFNSYGARRGNDRIMTRGTFANVQVRNALAKDDTGKAREGGWTRDFTRAHGWNAPIAYIYDAAVNYKQHGTPLVVIAGKDYGMGSSRDWAAKGTLLLGVRAVIAESFERIHRSNLVFMGVLPLIFKDGQTAASLGLDGTETFDIDLPQTMAPGADVAVRATSLDGKVKAFTCKSRIDTAVEIEYYRNGGILHTVLRKKLDLARSGAAAGA